MFKRILLASTVLWCLPACAQNITCPTRAVGDASNACASDAFVQNQIASGVGIVNSVTNADGSLTISPTVGAVVASVSSTAWGTYTPSPSCGTATFTLASARSKTLGKTTFAELDITITALGTCTNSFSFTLPNTANSSGGLVGRQTAGSGANVNCYIPTGTATAFCASTANFTANQIVLSGVYENQ